jgi:hypothetical protein
MIGAALSLAWCNTTSAAVGIWTSQDRSVRQGTVEIPTNFGRTLGNTVNVMPLSTVASAPDFGDFTWTGGISGNSQSTSFTPTTLLVQTSATADTTFIGNTTIRMNQRGHHVAATFHLDVDTPYSFEALPGLAGLFGVRVPNGHEPTLTGPGGQVITLGAAQTGSLAAGDWSFLLDYQMMYQPTPAAEPTFTAPSGPLQASFQLVVPEPASGLLVLAAISSSTLLRRARRGR